MHRLGTSTLLAIAVTSMVLVSPVSAIWIQNGVPVCTDSNWQTQPALVADGTGGAIIAWQDDRCGSHIFAQRVDADGVIQWTVDGDSIQAGANFCGTPQMVPDGVGGTIITWLNDLGSGWNVYLQRIDTNGNLLWPVNGVAACSHGAAGNQRIISDGAGGAIVVWEDNRTVPGDIYAQRIDASGSVLWAPNGVAVCTAVHNQWYPDLASDGMGGAIFAWEDWRGDPDKVYAQRVSASGVVEWAIDGILVRSDANSGYRPRMTSDGAGGAIVAWHSGSDVYAQRVNGEGEKLWGDDGIIVSAAEGYQVKPEIAPDGVGGAIVAWSDNRNDINWEFFAQRIAPNGYAVWTENGVEVCAYPCIKEEYSIASDGAGGVVFAWRDRRFDTGDIYMQRLGPNGDPLWGAYGIAACTAIDEQRHPRIVSDGAGGAMVTWQDSRDHMSNWTDIYVCRTLSTVTANESPSNSPELFLGQNIPNPFNPSTTIAYELGISTDAQLSIYDVSGRLVKVLIDGKNFSEGRHMVVWDGNDSYGNPVSSGVYFYRLEAGGRTLTKKMVLLK